MSKPSDDARGVCASMAEEMAGMSKAFSTLNPDIVVLLGDRYEILVAAETALIHCIPVAHIHGGEVTEGAFDDAIRHAVTKMSALHFTSAHSIVSALYSLVNSQSGCLTWARSAWRT